MKKVTLLIIGILFSLPVFSQAAEKLIKIGYIDIQKTLRSYSEGKKTVDFLKNLKESYEKKKGEMESEIKRLEKELETKAKELSEAQVRDYLTQIEGKRQELEIFIRNANADQEKKEREMLSPIYEKILNTIKEEAPKMGFNFIVDSKYVLVADPELDITDYIVKALEQKP